MSAGSPRGAASTGCGTDGRTGAGRTHGRRRRPAARRGSRTGGSSGGAGCSCTAPRPTPAPLRPGRRRWRRPRPAPSARPRARPGPPPCLPRMSSEKLPSRKAEGASCRRPRSRGSYTRCSPAEYMSRTRRAWRSGPPVTSQCTTRCRSRSRSCVHTMRGLWHRSSARAPAAPLTDDSDTTDPEPSPGPAPDGPAETRRTDGAGTAVRRWAGLGGRGPRSAGRWGRERMGAHLPTAPRSLEGGRGGGGGRVRLRGAQGPLLTAQPPSSIHRPRPRAPGHPHPGQVWLEEPWKLSPIRTAAQSPRACLHLPLRSDSPWSPEQTWPLQGAQTRGLPGGAALTLQHEQHPEEGPGARLHGARWPGRRALSGLPVSRKTAGPPPPQHPRDITEPWAGSDIARPPLPSAAPYPPRPRSACRKERGEGRGGECTAPRWLGTGIGR